MGFGRPWEDIRLPWLPTTVTNAKKPFNIKIIGEAVDWEAELFQMVHDLSNPGQQWPHPSDFQFAAF